MFYFNFLNPKKKFNVLPLVRSYFPYWKFQGSKPTQISKVSSQLRMLMIGPNREFHDPTIIYLHIFSDLHVTQQWKICHRFIHTTFVQMVMLHLKFKPYTEFEGPTPTKIFKVISLLKISSLLIFSSFHSYRLIQFKRLTYLIWHWFEIWHRFINYAKRYSLNMFNCKVLHILKK